MPSIRINKNLCDQIYFVTFTVINWYYFFDRFERFKILEESFFYCQKNKRLKIYAFVFMSNHLHFIGSAENLSVVICDMKKYLSKKFKQNIKQNEPHLLKEFKRNGKYRFWQKTNYPKLITSENFFQQKVDYIHNNPVKKIYVSRPEDWRWSSANKMDEKIKISRLG